MVYSQNIFAGRISNLEKNFQTKNGIADHPEPIANSLWLYVTSLLMLRSVTQIQRKKMSLRHIQDFVLRP